MHRIVDIINKQVNKWLKRGEKKGIRWHAMWWCFLMDELEMLIDWCDDNITLLFFLLVNKLLSLLKNKYFPVIKGRSFFLLLKETYFGILHWKKTFSYKYSVITNYSLLVTIQRILDISNHLSVPIHLHPVASNIQGK